MSRDQAVTNAQDFCKQNNKVTYSQGSVNELKMSITKPQDDKKGPTDAPERVGRFTNIVIDACDGNYPVNNPHDYKFGSTYTSPDGCEYTMQPLSKQVNEVSYGVAYKYSTTDY
ncbi:SGNH hydrolase-type esterase domain protein [Rutstroemia sp. NJR-2017a BBW]|nr:SGNH hydrolase-type esterase domain protein [Rutstroemia sp. NJR-2017a BBW]